MLNNTTIAEGILPVRQPISLSTPIVSIGTDSVSIWHNDQCLFQWKESEWTKNPALVYEIADTIRLVFTDVRRLKGQQ